MCPGCGSGGAAREARGSPPPPPFRRPRPAGTGLPPRRPDGRVGKALKTGAEAAVCDHVLVETNLAAWLQDSAKLGGGDPASLSNAVTEGFQSAFIGGARNRSPRRGADALASSHRRHVARTPGSVRARAAGLLEGREVLALKGARGGRHDLNLLAPGERWISNSRRIHCGEHNEKEKEKWERSWSANWSP